MDNPFFRAFRKTAQKEPERVCFELYSGADARQVTRISFGEMYRAICAAGQRFVEAGVGTGDVVLIFAQHSKGMLASFFGAQWIGAIPAFMPPPTVKQDVASWGRSHSQLMERIQPKLIVCEPHCELHLRSLEVEQLLLTSAIEKLAPASDLALNEVDLDQIAFLQHSSGTTGLKKGVTVTYRQLMSQVDTYAETIGFNGADDVVSWLPIYHDMGLIAATLMPFRYAAKVQLIDTFAWLSNPSIFMDLLSRSSSSFSWLPNFAFNYLAKRTRLQLDSDALSGVRAIINCSEPCKMSDMTAFIDRFEASGLRRSAVQVCYAAAEYVFAMTQTDVDQPIEPAYADERCLADDHKFVAIEPTSPHAKPIVPVGRALPGADIVIGDGSAEGAVGEIKIRGPSLCLGYFRNEKITKEKFVNGWYRTGDLGFQANGLFYVTGRMDDLIIVRGKNIYAHDVEAIAGSTPGVKPGRAIAFGVDDQSGTCALVVAVEALAGADARQIQIEVSAEVNDAFGIVPTEIYVAAENTLVKTTSGKISRSENRARYLSGTLHQYR